MDQKAMQMELLNKEASVRESIETMLFRLDEKEAMLKQKEEALRQGLLQNSDVRNMRANLFSALPSYLAPGNVGDINRVIWPFFFTTDNINPIGPETNIRTAYSVTQEAGFVWMVHMKAIYSYDSITGVLTYIDPDEPMTGSADGLQVSIRDAQSTREFMRAPIDIDHIGNPRWPSALPSPMLVIPNGVIEVTFNNTHPTNYYLPFLTFFGYRMRLEGAQNILSTVYG